MQRQPRPLTASAVGLIAVLALGLATRTFEADEAPVPVQSESPSASASPTPIWPQLPAGMTRTAEIEVVSTAGFGLVTHRIRLRMDIGRDDPLAAATLSGVLPAHTLLEAMGLRYTADWPYPPPAIEWDGNRERATLLLDVGGSSQTSEAGVAQSWQLFRFNGNPAASGVSRWKVTIRATNFTIAGAAGFDRSRQDAHTVEFEGRPGDVAIFAQLDGSLESASDTDAADDGPMHVLRGWGRWGWLAGLLLLSAPWLVLVTALHLARRRGRAGVDRPLWVATAILALLTLYHVSRSPAFYAALLLSGPTAFATALVLAVALLRTARGQKWWTTGLLATLAIVGVACPAVACLVVLAAGGTFSIFSLGLLLAAVFLFLVAGLAAHRLAGGRLLARVLAMCAIAGISSLAVLASFDDYGPAAANAAGGAAAACILWVGAGGLSRRRSLRATAGVGVLVALAGAMLLVPLAGVTVGPLEVYGRFGPFSWGTPARDLLSLVLVVVILRYLRQGGRHPRAQEDQLCLALLLVLVLVATVEDGDVPWLNVAAAAITIAIWWWLVSTASHRAATAVARVTAGHHLRLVRAEVRRRVTQLSGHDLYRRARSDLQAGELTLREYDAAQRRLDDAASPLEKRVDGVPLSLALSTAAGQPPWRNAVAAVTYVLPLALVFAGYEVWLLLSGDDRHWLLQSTPSLGIQVLHIGRWLVYGLLYGFAYPWLRGRTPVAKALAMVLFVLPGELLTALSGVPRYLDPDDPELDEMIIPRAGEVLAALGIRTGQVLVFLLLLGLMWERRLANLAGYGWDRLRNVRSIRALATPAGTVIVAVATAAGTAIAGAAVATMLTTGTPPPATPPSPSPATTPSPSHP